MCLWFVGITSDGYRCFANQSTVEMVYFNHESIRIILLRLLNKEHLVLREYKMKNINVYYIIVTSSMFFIYTI